MPSELAGTDLPSQISDILEEAIISGVLKPGERLRADALAAHYGVSRIPVREALRSLEAAGWVEIRPRHGVFVSERSEEELTALFDVRAVLEGHVAQRAAERRTEADLAQLTRTIELSRKAAARGNVSALAGLGVKFHVAVRQAARNSVLQETLGRLEKRARFYYTTVAEDLSPDWVHVHESLLSAIEAQDAATARKLSTRHIEETGRAVHELLLSRADPRL